MEYYWELRSKNAQNIKTLMCPQYVSEDLLNCKKLFLNYQQNNLRKEMDQAKHCFVPESFQV